MDELTVLQPGTGWLPWSTGYGGNIYATPVGTVSESFAVNTTLHELGFYVAPDIGGPVAGTASVTVTLSDGTTLTPAASFSGSSPAFFGLASGDITGFTVSTTAPDFAIGAFRSVPAPGGLGLLAVGLGTLALLRRR